MTDESKHLQGASSPNTDALKEPTVPYNTLSQPEIAKNGQDFVSAGTKIHNELTYRGVDWIVNSSVGVGFTYWADRTAMGKKYFGDPVQAAAESMLKPLFKSEAALAEGSKWFRMFASIMAGGTAIIPVMTALENKDNKKAIIKHFDEMCYGKDAVEHDPKFHECYKKIDEEPPKDFSTGMAARLVAIAPLIAASSTPAINERLIKYLYNPIAKLSKRGASAVGIEGGKLLERGAMELADGNPASKPTFVSDWDFIHRTIGFDFGLTIAYAYLHEKSYKAFSALRYGNKKASEAEPQIAETSHQQLQHTSDLDISREKQWIQNVGEKKSIDHHISQKSHKPEKSDKFVDLVQTRTASGAELAG